MTSRKDGGEALMEAFRDLDVECIFCSPGSEWAPIWEAVARQDAGGLPGPRYFDLMHETVAVGMAIGYYQVTGRMQAVLLHATAGLLQGGCAIQGAWLADVPMIVASSESNSYGEREGVDPGRQWHRNLSFVGGPHSVPERFVKWSCQVPGVETLYEFVKRAGEIAQERPPGPVYLNCPVEVLLDEWQPRPLAKKVPPTGQSVAPEEDIEALVAEIRAARQPVVLVESLGRYPGGPEVLARFAEAFGLPVHEGASATSWNLDQAHPHSLEGEPCGQWDDVDLVILIKARAPWYPPSAGYAGARVVVIDDAPLRQQMVYQVLHADRYVAGDVLSNLARAAERGRSSEHGARIARVRELHRQQTEARERREAAAKLADGPIDPLSLILALRERLPASIRVFDETITHASLVRGHLRRDGHGSYHAVAGGLGQGIGVALGAKLAAPEDFVLLTIGDGAFLYNPVLPALMASVREGLPILTVVFNNGQYLSMKNNHLRVYPGGHGVRRNRFHGVDLSDQPRFEVAAESCGCVGMTLRKRADMAATIEAAISAVQSGRSVVLDVHLTH